MCVVPMMHVHVKYLSYAVLKLISILASLCLGQCICMRRRWYEQQHHRLGHRRRGYGIASSGVYRHRNRSRGYPVS